MGGSTNAKPHVLVAGAGIGGLAAALCLLERGIDCDIYEQAPELKEVGAGLWLSVNGARVLFSLGLEPEIRRATLEADPARHAPYLARGVRLLPCAAADGRVDLARLLQMLAADGINELMVEAGAGLNGALVAAGLVDEAVLYLAPYLAGDAARGLFAWPALESLDDKVPLAVRDLRLVGRDIRLGLAFPPR